MEIDEVVISIQNLHLVMLSTVYLKDKIEPEQVPLTFINLLHDKVKVAKHTVIRSFRLYTDYQELPMF